MKNLVFYNFTEEFDTKMQYNYSDPRLTYKLLEKITSGEYLSGSELLKAVVREVIKNSEFDIIGGRIWKLEPEDSSYNLIYQYGKVKKIPNDYKLPISSQPILDDLVKQRAILNRETDQLLLAKGINMYSVVGVGEIHKLSNGKKYYEYAIGFNAEAILQSFFETLSIISSVSTIALRNLSQQEKHEKINKDLSQASEIQRNLLPEHYLEFSDFKIYGVCIPDSAVGGDYFDYIKNKDEYDERLGIVISDAASKGLPAAIQALFVSGAIKMGLSFSTRIGRLFSFLNKLVWETFPYERFVTLCYVELTLSESRMVLYCNAGHFPPIHYRYDMDSFRMLQSTGSFLGLLEEEKYNVENFNMHPGDILALYTDGIIEARNKEGKLYGVDRLIKIIRKFRDHYVKEIIAYIIEDVQKYSAGTYDNDDKTLVVIKRDMK